MSTHIKLSCMFHHHFYSTCKLTVIKCIILSKIYLVFEDIPLSLLEYKWIYTLQTCKFNYFFKLLLLEYTSAFSSLYFTKFFEIMPFIWRLSSQKKWSDEGLSLLVIHCSFSQFLDYQINIGSYLLWAPFILRSIILC